MVTAAMGVVGLVAGVAITVPATFFALLSRTGEALYPYLVPSTWLPGQR